MGESGQKKLRVSYNAPVVLTFSIISFLALLLGILTNNKSTQLLFCTYRSSFTDILMYLRLFTHVLGHANWQHFFNNMLMFMLIGPLLEEKYGSKMILEMIVLTAGITGLLNNILFPHTALLGASGIVFMFIMLSSLTAFREKEIPLTFIVVLVMYIGQEIINGLFTSDNIAQSAHLLGGACGSFFGFFVNKNKKAV